MYGLFIGFVTVHSLKNAIWKMPMIWYVYNNIHVQRTWIVLWILKHVDTMLGNDHFSIGNNNINFQEWINSRTSVTNQYKFHCPFYLSSIWVLYRPSLKYRPESREQCKVQNMWHTDRASDIIYTEHVILQMQNNCLTKCWIKVN